MKTITELIDVEFLEEKLKNGWRKRNIVLVENIQLPPDHPLKKKEYSLLCAGTSLNSYLLSRIKDFNVRHLYVQVR